MITPVAVTVLERGNLARRGPAGTHSPGGGRSTDPSPESERDADNPKRVPSVGPVLGSADITRMPSSTPIETLRSRALAVQEMIESYAKAGYDALHIEAVGRTIGN